ncbi:hypothetical protein [Paenibacillus xylanexedens]|uniref:hypothetical protein n=1 Tax=Paenibacillus xylanexedens TaxID=528191 RepID=UPI00119DFF12|nr:hypothetical protein [Paenibacillus xylanexedens]
MMDLDAKFLEMWTKEDEDLIGLKSNINTLVLKKKSKILDNDKRNKSSIPLTQAILALEKKRKDDQDLNRLLCTF